MREFVCVRMSRLREYIMLLAVLLASPFEMAAARFTINSVGMQVEIADANIVLQSHSFAWSFGTPTGMVGEAAVLGGAPSETLDLFGWSGDTYRLWGVSALTASSVYEGAFLDWGQNISVGEGEEAWNTLTAEEWEYVLTGRHNAASLQGYATIDGVGGLVILRDSSSLTIQSSYTSAEWASVQADGAVFLPAAGERKGGQTVDLSRGVYWTATPVGTTQAKCLVIDNAGARIESKDRACGGAVRVARRMARIVEIISDGCYEFDHWSDGSTENPRTFGAGETGITPVLRPIVRTITGSVESGSVGWGTVSISIE